jgi:lycopene cyclase domain-containing protein
MISEKLTYITVNFLSFVFPFLFSLTEKYDFRNYWKSFFIANFFTACIYIVWDSIYTRLGVWGFDPQYVLGLYFFNLPLEEILFFVCVPYASVFTYYCFQKYVFKKIHWDFKVLWIVFGLLFALLGLVYRSKYYTGFAFFSCAIIFLLAGYLKYVRFVDFLLFYAVILLPFFLVNGILTGSFLGRVVVFYNDTENLGIRLGTIPFEDVFYGMGMLLLNILLFEYFRKYFSRDQSYH